MPQRIGVLGAGGMGSAFAAYLARADRPAVLIGRGSDHVTRLADHPMQIEPPDGPPWQVRVPVAASVAEVAAGSIDVLLILTKAYDLADASAGAAHLLAPDGVAVPLQNGLGTDALTATAFGPERTLVGITTVGAALLSPGRVSVSQATAAGTTLTSVGSMGQAHASPQDAAMVARLLTSAGLPAAADPRMDRLIWGKLALAAMSPLSAVPRVPVATVWSSPEGRALVERMFDEVVAVAAAVGVDLDRDAAWEHASATFDGTGHHYTSMCTDVIAGRRTELASMGAAVVALADEHHVPIPAHRTVIQLLAVAGVR